MQKTCILIPDSQLVQSSLQTEEYCYVFVVDISSRHRMSRGLSQTPDIRTEIPATSYVDHILH